VSREGKVMLERNVEFEQGRRMVFGQNERARGHDEF